MDVDDAAVYILCALALVIINNEIHGTCVEEGVQLLRAGLGQGSRDLGRNRIVENTSHIDQISVSMKLGHCVEVVDAWYIVPMKNSTMVRIITL